MNVSNKEKYAMKTSTKVTAGHNQQDLSQLEEFHRVDDHHRDEEDNGKNDSGKDDVISMVSSSMKTIGEEDQVQSNDGTLVQVGAMPYRNFRVSIFKKTGGEFDLFYYEPIVSLDPKSIVSNVIHGSRYEVAFTVELWNAQLENRIVKYLREKGGRWQQLENLHVQVMPYEEVRLVGLDYYDCKESSITFQLPCRPKSFLQQSQSLDFGLLSNSKETAEMVANPKYLANHLALEFKSPALGQHAEASFHHRAASGIRRSNRFELNVMRNVAANNKKREVQQQESVVIINETLAQVQQFLRVFVQEAKVEREEMRTKWNQLNLQIEDLKGKLTTLSITQSTRTYNSAAIRHAQLPVAYHL